MKKLFRTFLMAAVVANFAFFAAQAFAADEAAPAGEPKQITFTVKIIGVAGFNEFNTLSKDLERISGVDELLPAKLARGEATLVGKFTGDAEMLANDMAVATMDRYKLEKKQSKDRVDFRLSKM